MQPSLCRPEGTRDRHNPRLEHTCVRRSVCSDLSVPCLFRNSRCIIACSRCAGTDGMEELKGQSASSRHRPAGLGTICLLCGQALPPACRLAKSRVCPSHCVIAALLAQPHCGSVSLAAARPSTGCPSAPGGILALLDGWRPKSSSPRFLLFSCPGHFPFQNPSSLSALPHDKNEPGLLRVKTPHLLVHIDFWIEFSSNLRAGFCSLNSHSRCHSPGRHLRFFPSINHQLPGSATHRI
jgi:hypothetical protein